MFVLKDKQYRLIDFLAIHFSVAPILTSIKVIGQILKGILPSIQVLATAYFIDTALAVFSGDLVYQSIYKPIAIVVALISYSYISDKLFTFADIRLNIKITEVIKSEVIKKRAKLEYKHIEDNNTWDLVNRTCERPEENIRQGFNTLLGIAELVIRVISLLVILSAQVWWLGFAIVAISVPLFGVAIKAGQTNYEAYKEANKYTRRANYLNDVLIRRESYLERYLFNYTDSISDKWSEQYETSRKIEQKAMAQNFIRMKASSIIVVMISIIITATLVIPLDQGIITVGVFIALVQASFSLVMDMSWTLGHLTSEIAKNKKYLDDLSGFVALSEAKESLAVPDQKIYEKGIREIVFKDVSFKYPGKEQYILKDFNLTLDATKHYAFVGSNGAGKTTITKLLTGLYDNYEGEIKIDGVNLRAYTGSEKKAFFALVYQDFAKYYVSVKENMAIGANHQVMDETVEEVTCALELNEVIEELPQGMATNLGKIRKDSVDLSGGQWQRLAIARALVSKAGMYILDEPTAALDAIAESNIYRLFDEISKHKGALFITHRLGATKIADQIILIADGKVSEQGTHDELMALSGQYANMYNQQKGWYQ